MAGPDRCAILTCVRSIASTRVLFRALGSRRRSVVNGVRLSLGLVMRSARSQFVTTLLLSLVVSVATAIELLSIRRVVASLSGESGDGIRELVPWLGLLGAAMLSSSLAGTAIGELRVLLISLVQQRSMDRVLETAVSAELEAFESPDFHDRLSRAREHSETSARQVVGGLVALLTIAASLVAVSAVLMTIAPVMVVVAIVAFVPLAVVGAVNSRRLYGLEYGLTEVDRDREYHARLLTGRLEAKEVRAFGLGAWLRGRHTELFDQRVEATRQVVRRRVVTALVGTAVTTVIIVLTLAQVAVLVLDGRIKLSDGAVALLGIQQLAARMRLVTVAFNSILEGVSFLQDFARLDDLAQFGRRTVVVRSEPVPRPSSVQLDGVRYVYPAAVAESLRGVSIDLRAGRVVAIVGPNGSGKSTLAKIVCGLLPPHGGRVLWDGVDVSTVDPAELRRHVAPVFQDFTRFEHTVREAIAFGDIAEAIDDDRVREAARRAGVSQFVERLPLGYATRLSTAYRDGVELSVGQWQRMAIARAFYRDAAVVVMDEPAASLDPRAEHELVERLHELGKHRTVLYVSHRFATVRRADEIVVLFEGEVIEQGSHEELMARGGMYAELYEIQAARLR